MVAAAAMAGVPLLNGFLSKEMFFAETIEIHDNSLVDQALPYIVTRREHVHGRLLAALHTRSLFWAASAGATAHAT